jgi:hypothetical protein
MVYYFWSSNTIGLFACSGSIALHANNTNIAFSGTLH